jgi:large subunit ribosomal protein L7e
MSQAPPKP